MTSPGLRFIVVLGALTAFAPLSIDMYLPAFPQLAREFAASAAAVQYTLSAFFIGLALGQLFWGPLSDRYGRKPPLYAGLVLFLLASIGCSLVRDLDQLIALRFLQAFGGCAGVVMARAMVRDTCDAQTAAKVFSLLMLVMGLAPILAPSLGAALLNLGNWRLMFWVLAAFGFANLLSTRFAMAETHAGNAQQSLHIREQLANYFSLLRAPRFRAPACASAVAMSALFAYITASPFVLMQQFGLTPAQYSLVFGANAAGLISLSQLNRRWLRKHSPETIFRRAFVLPMLCAIVMGIALQLQLLALLLPALFLFIASLGLIMPNGTAIALREQGQRAGAASALLGTLQFSAASLSSYAVSTLTGMNSAMALVMGIAAFISFWFARQTARA